LRGVFGSVYVRSMPLTSAIQPYDPRWPQNYADEAERLIPIFGSSLVETHHVGSTAVPELAAKPEIDILAVINMTGVPDQWTPSFEKQGYRRGGDLSPGHHFFKRDIGGVRTHKLHICHEGHPTISEMLRFRDHLRQHPADRLKYQELKLKLERENTEGIREYLAAKAPFIHAILASLD
jgi:GrpB-like predicted nucleotidyltransferase (UPF0157 family)